MVVLQFLNMFDSFLECCISDVSCQVLFLGRYGGGTGRCKLPRLADGCKLCIDAN